MVLFNCRSLLVFCAFSLLVSGFGYRISRVSSDDVLLKSRLAILALKNIDYDCRFQQKFAGGNDTLKTSANIAMELKNKDSLLGCDMKMTGQFHFYAVAIKSELFYNGKKNITLNHTKKKATVDTTGKRGKGRPTMNMLKQNFPTANLLYHYTEKLPYEPFFKNTTKVTMLQDEKVGAYTCFKLEIIALDPDKKKRTVQLFIDKKSYLPVRRIDWVDHSDFKTQYSDFTLSAIKTNDPQINDMIKEPSIPKGYDVEFYRIDPYLKERY